MRDKCRNNNGFSLIELSIVLVIVGLIVGGVLVGRDLIKAAETRKIITQIERLRTATNTFRVTYGSIPGDITNASSFWPAECVSCNGDGNGLIGKTSVSANNAEPVNFWQHLSFAKLVPTVTNGLAMPSDISANAYFHVHYLMLSGHPSTNYVTLAGLIGDVAATIGGGSGADSTVPALYGQGVMTGSAAYAVDRKIDDGYGGNYEASGKVFGDTGCVIADGSSGFMCTDGYATNCLSSGTSYNLTSSEKNCLLNFTLQ